MEIFINTQINKTHKDDERYCAQPGIDFKKIVAFNNITLLQQYFNETFEHNTNYMIPYVVTHLSKNSQSFPDHLRTIRLNWETRKKHCLQNVLYRIRRTTCVFSSELGKKPKTDFIVKNVFFVLNKCIQICLCGLTV